jgi:hypothetical protein
MARGIFKHPHVADYRLGSERLGSVPLPDPGAHAEPIGGRTYKRALEILILANALADPELGDIVIDDDGGKRERPDFRVFSSAVGEIDVEVTQLRSETTATAGHAVQKLQDALRKAVSADAELAAACKPLLVNISPWPDALSFKTMDNTVVAFVNHMRGRLRLIHDPQLRCSGMVHFHDIDDANARHRGITVSPPLPRYGAKTDIDISGLVNEKRQQARTYRRPGVPLWLAIGVTADFGQLEVTVDDTLGDIAEILPFDRAVAVDQRRVVPITPTPDRAQHDLLGRAWHEAGHAVAAIRLGIPLISTTIERSHGSENGSTEVYPGYAIPPMDDALYTAAGAQAQTASSFSSPFTVKNNSFDDREALEHDIAGRAGVAKGPDSYWFAETAEEQARTFVGTQTAAINAVAQMLLADGTVSGKRIVKAVSGK